MAGLRAGGKPWTAPTRRFTVGCVVETVTDIACQLGEGPCWQAGRLWWCDILGGRIHGAEPGGAAQTIEVGRAVSAVFRLGADRLMLATDRGLMRCDPATGALTDRVPLELDRPETRSNDGRVDPWGAIWLGTMGRAAEAGAGTLYRLGPDGPTALRSITIPNATCFAPDRSAAYVADSAERTIWRWALDAEGWPVGEPVPLVSGLAEGIPDGALVDRTGTLWVALWGGGGLAPISPSGAVGDVIPLPARNPTCPASWPGMAGRLFVTSAREDTDLAADPLAGRLFAVDVPAEFPAEVVLDPKVWG